MGELCVPFKKNSRYNITANRIRWLIAADVLGVCSRRRKKKRKKEKKLDGKYALNENQTCRSGIRPPQTAATSPPVFLAPVDDRLFAL